MPNQIKITEANRFSLYVKPDDKENLASLYRWAEWFRTRGIPFVMMELEKGWAIWKLPPQTLRCKGCRNETAVEEAREILCKACKDRILENLGV